MADKTTDTAAPEKAPAAQTTKAAAPAAKADKADVPKADPARAAELRAEADALDPVKRDPRFGSAGNPVAAPAGSGDAGLGNQTSDAPYMRSAVQAEQAETGERVERKPRDDGPDAA